MIFLNFMGAIYNVFVCQNKNLISAIYKVGNEIFRIKFSLYAFHRNLFLQIFALGA